MLIAHPAKAVVTPAYLLKRKPEQAEGTLLVPDAFDLEHRCSPSFLGKFACIRPPRVRSWTARRPSAIFPAAAAEPESTNLPVV